MPNQAVSQTVASAQFDRFLQPDRKASLLEDLFYLFSTNTAYVRQDGGYTTAGVRMLTAWSLSGVNLSDLDKNVAADGRLWIRVTANGGNWDIHIYKALAAASEVATATNVAAGAVATLTAANSSGLTGSCTLAASIAAIANDTYSIQVFLGFGQMDRQILNGLHQEDASILDEQLALNTACADALAGLMAQCNRSAESAKMLEQLGRLWVVNPRIGFLAKTVVNDDGVVSVTVDGVFERFRQNWEDNTTVQKVAVTTIAAAAASYDAGNQGTSTAVLGSAGPNLEPGTIQAVCVEDGPSFDEVRFRVTFQPTDGTGPVDGKELLTVGKAWDDPDIPVSISLTFGYLLADDDGDGTDVAATTQITTMTGLTEDNSDNGKLYGKVVASGASFIYKFYEDSARTLLVAQSTAVAAATAFSATQQNRSGITIGWKSGTAPADADLFSIATRPHKKGDSTNAPDQFTIAITRSALGRIQDTARRYHGWKYHQASSPTFADTFIQRGSLFIDGEL